MQLIIYRESKQKKKTIKATVATSTALKADAATKTTKIRITVIYCKSRIMIVLFFQNFWAWETRKWLRYFLFSRAVPDIHFLFDLLLILVMEYKSLLSQVTNKMNAKSMYWWKIWTWKMLSEIEWKSVCINLKSVNNKKFDWKRYLLIQWLTDRYIC